MLNILDHKGDAIQNYIETPVRIAIINNTNNSKCCQGHKQKGCFYTPGGKVN
jgi:hypothetical protein